MMLKFDAVPAGSHQHLTLWGGQDRDHLALCGRFVLDAAGWEFLKRILLDGRRPAEYATLPREGAPPGETAAVFDSLQDMTSGLPRGTFIGDILRDLAKATATGCCDTPPSNVLLRVPASPPPRSGALALERASPSGGARGVAPDLPTWVPLATDTDAKDASPRGEAASHRARHAELHDALSELLADFMVATGGRPSMTTVTELMLWSGRQAELPDHQERQAVKSRHCR